MSDINKSYRIRTDVGGVNSKDVTPVLNVQLNQTYDMLEVLSLKINTKDTYKFYECSYGVIVGRVVANGGFGVPNVKISIFIEGDIDDVATSKLMYNFGTPRDLDKNGVRYNLLPDDVDNVCHATVGTFPNKRLVLDNNDVIEVFDKYWKYTTVTNEAGDYMLFGVPTGNQNLHVDLDLSDCGTLSQRPRDLIAKGFNPTQFDSPNKFKASTDLQSLAQIITQDRGIYVYPYWGEESENSEMLSITRCDIEISYKFEPYAVFIGSMITDKGGNAIGKNCSGTETLGKMSDLATGEGKIEMIRKTLDDNVEQYQIMGDRLIDGDGVWCYTIPMNLDYVRTDEFGNLVPTDDPSKGIPTRARVRFRFTMDESPTDATARKRCRYLVPNNPRLDEERYPGFCETKEPDYSFGSATLEESYCDMFWNKVYSVKNYIPRLQKNSKETNRKHTGIKLINHYGDNNPMPYNSLTIKLSFTYRLICVLIKVIIYIIEFINFILGALATPFCVLKKALEGIGKAFSFKILGVCPLCFVKKLLIDPLIKLCNGLIINCISLSSDFCDDGVNPNKYYPGCGSGLGSIFKWCIWDGKAYPNCVKEQRGKSPEDQLYCTNNTGQLFSCIENQLAQSNDATSFCFYNDWINGSIYAPLWYRHIKPKKKFFFGLISRKAKDDWCDANQRFEAMRLYQPCAVDLETGGTTQNLQNTTVQKYKMTTGGSCGKNCHKERAESKGMNGLIVTRETMIGQTVYYYKSVEYVQSDDKPESGFDGFVRIFFATDIILLGSLNDYDLDGIPQFFKSLESTTYNMPTDVLFTDNDLEYSFEKDTGRLIQTLTSTTEIAGCDWGNKNEYGKEDGGLFYSIGCADITMIPKSCINLQRICEFGVSLDETKTIPNLGNLNSGDTNIRKDDILIADGFVSFDELYDTDGRSMFATLNGNGLRTRLNPKNGLKVYDFRHLYPYNFDGSLARVMQNQTSAYNNTVPYKNNYKLEEMSDDYYLFRMGDNPYLYLQNKFPRFENSFYFYFGLKQGKTAIEKFNSQYFADCESVGGTTMQIDISTGANEWCQDTMVEGMVESSKETVNLSSFVKLNLKNITTPYNIIINNKNDKTQSWACNDIVYEKLFIGHDKDDLGDIDGYAVLKKIDASDNNSYTYALKNGEYEITITDADGNISSAMFEINIGYLTFDTDVQKFTISNRELITKYEKFSDIANCKQGFSLKDKNRDIGGLIVIDNILDYKRQPLRDFVISIAVSSNSQITNYTHPTLEIHKSASGNIEYKDSGNGILNSKVADGYSSLKVPFIFGIPKGGVSYIVSITQLCLQKKKEEGVETEEWVQTNNHVEYMITVDEPTPYKMFINNIDYDIIKNFITGWKLNSSSTTTKPSIVTVNNDIEGKVKTWVTFANTKTDKNYVLKYHDISNTDSVYPITELTTELNLDSVGYMAEDDKSNDDNNTYPFLWDADPKYTLDYYDFGWYIQLYVDAQTRENATTNETEKKEIQQEMNNIKNTIDGIVRNVITLRRQFIEQMKNAFWLSCPMQSASLSVSVTTDDMPYDGRIIYRAEIHDDETGEYLAEYSDAYSITEEGMLVVNDINIPTLTAGKNNSIIYTPITPGKGTFSQKSPYFIAVVNNKGQSIPSDAGVVRKPHGDVKYYTLEGKTSNYFGVHFVDKRLYYNILIWSPFNYMITTDGTCVNMSGFMAAYIQNGVAPYSDLSLGNKRLNYITLNGETSLPTHRYIYDDNDCTIRYKGVSNYINKTYGTGLSANTNIKNMQCVKIGANRKTLTITDNSGCSVTTTVDGLLKVVTDNTMISYDTEVKFTALYNRRKKVNFSVSREANKMHVNVNGKKEFANTLRVKLSDTTTDKVVYTLYNTNTVSYPLDLLVNKTINCKYTKDTDAIGLSGVITYNHPLITGETCTSQVDVDGNTDIQGNSVQIIENDSKRYALVTYGNRVVKQQIDNNGDKFVMDITVLDGEEHQDIWSLDAIQKPIETSAITWTEDENGNNVVAWGSGTSGTFFIGNYGTYFVIAEGISTINGGSKCVTRTLSPLYCFAEGLGIKGFQFIKKKTYASILWKTSVNGDVYYYLQIAFNIPKEAITLNNKPAYLQVKLANWEITEDGETTEYAVYAEDASYAYSTPKTRFMRDVKNDVSVDNSNLSGDDVLVVSTSYTKVFKYGDFFKHENNVYSYDGQNWERVDDGIAQILINNNVQYLPYSYFVRVDNTDNIDESDIPNELNVIKAKPWLAVTIKDYSGIKSETKVSEIIVPNNI